MPPRLHLLPTGIALPPSALQQESEEPAEEDLGLEEVQVGMVCAAQSELMCQPADVHALGT